MNLQTNADFGTIIPSYLDDYGLDVYEFRIYARISRRAGCGQCFESIDKMAAGCKMSDKRAKAALLSLQELGMINRQNRIGKSSIWTLTHPSTWLTKGHSDLGKKFTPQDDTWGKSSPPKMTPGEKVHPPTWGKSSPTPGEDIPPEGIKVRNQDLRNQENTPYVPHAENPDFGCGEEEGKEGQNANLQEAELQQPSLQTQEGGLTPNTQEVELQRVIATNSSFPDQNQNLSTQTDILIRGGSSAAVPQFTPASEVNNPPQSQETGNLSKSTPPTPQAAKKPRKMNEAETADLIEEMTLNDQNIPNQRLTGRLLPWELSTGPNGLDPAFTTWLEKALPKVTPSYRDGCSPLQAKQWLRQSRFDVSRLNSAFLQWQEYQESITKKQQIEQQQIEQQSIQTRSKSRWDSDEFMSRERLQQKAKELLESGIIKKVAA